MIKKHFRNLSVLILALVVLSMAFVGIGGTYQAGASGSTPALQTNASASIPHNGTLYMSTGPGPAFVDNFNPFNIWSPPAGIMSLFYEPLLQINTYNGTVIPWLATGYNWTDNNLVLNMQLRQGVTFSNGMPFNSSDVVFTFHDQMKLFGQWGFLSNVTANGPYQVNFTFKTPQVQDLFYIGSNFIIPKALWQNYSTPQKTVVTNPIGTGPFVLSQVTAQTITLTRNTNYWMPNEPHLNKVVFVDYTSNSALTLALGQGKIQWTALFAPNITSVFVNKNPSANHYWYPQGQPVTLITNDNQTPLNHSFFRQAMSLSINRTQIWQTGEYGYEQPANAANILKQQLFWLNSTNSQLAEYLSSYNVSAAIKLLSDHGYKIVSGKLTAPNGTAVAPMTLMTVAGYSDWDTDIGLIANDLKAIGLTVNIVTPTQGALSTDIADGNYTMALYTDTGIGPNPWYDWSGLVGKVLAVGNPASVNVERWNASSTNFMQYFNSFGNVSSASQQKVLINDMATIILNQMPMIPLVYSANWYEYVNSTIGGFPNAANPYWIPMPWYPGPMEVVTLHLYDIAAVQNATSGTSQLAHYELIGGVVAAVVIIGGVVGYSLSRKKRMKED